MAVSDNYDLSLSVPFSCPLFLFLPPSPLYLLCFLPPCSLSDLSQPTNPIPSCNNPILSSVVQEYLLGQYKSVGDAMKFSEQKLVSWWISKLHGYQYPLLVSLPYFVSVG